MFSLVLQGSYGYANSRLQPLPLFDSRKSGNVLSLLLPNDDDLANELDCVFEITRNSKFFRSVLLKIHNEAWVSMFWIDSWELIDAHLFELCFQQMEEQFKALIVLSHYLEVCQQQSLLRAETVWGRLVLKLSIWKHSFCFCRLGGSNSSGMKLPRTVTFSRLFQVTKFLNHQ